MPSDLFTVLKNYFQGLIIIIIRIINNKLDTSPNDILYTSKPGNRKEEAHKIEYTYIEQTYTTNITEEKETKNIKQA